MHDRITLSWLEQCEACASQRSMFGEIFGPEAPLTRANLQIAARAGLAIDWLARRLIPDSAARYVFNDRTRAALMLLNDTARVAEQVRLAANRPALAAYVADRDAAWTLYQDAILPLARAFDEAPGPEKTEKWQRYIAARDAALAEHDTRMLPLRQALSAVLNETDLAYKAATASAERLYHETAATALADLLGLP